MAICRIFYQVLRLPATPNRSGQLQFGLLMNPTYLSIRPTSSSSSSSSSDEEEVEKKKEDKHEKKHKKCEAQEERKNETAQDPGPARRGPGRPKVHHGRPGQVNVVETSVKEKDSSSASSKIPSKNKNE